VTTRYPGGVITKTPVVPAGPYENGAAPGVWTLEQQLQAQKAGIWPTAGNIDPSLFIENIFSTWLYTGNGSTQTITNGINLSTQGGLVWIKSRSAATNNFLFDTTRGALNEINSNTTDAQASLAASLTAFNTTGFALGAAAGINVSAATYASWTFREQPKFFDIVTYTGTGANRTIAHNLGSVPGCIFVKRTDAAADWQVYHRSLANTQYMVLNSTAAVATGATRWNSTTPTSTVFSVGTDTTVNASGGTYVAYIFAHNAGGFGNAGTDDVISCGSFITNGSGAVPVQNLGYEPQWILYKPTDAPTDWIIGDNMRGIQPNSAGAENNVANILYTNLSSAENSGGQTFFTLSPTGFYSNANFGASRTFTYIAIRRGPMKTPTVGTSVFGLNARTGTGAIATVTGGQTDDAVLIKNRGAAVASLFSSRLTGTGYLVTSGTSAEVAAGTTILQANPWDVMDGVKVGTTSTITNASANTFINYLFRRAPGFFDVVCYTGTGSAGATYSHNLNSIPELMIFKCRPNSQPWAVYSNLTGNTKTLNLSTTAAAVTDTTVWNSTSPTSSIFTVGSSGFVNGGGTTYVAYLFATLAGVSKVGSYTGTGATLTVNCGFTTGARFVLIKRTDAVGDWYVWDSARGIVAGNDPYIVLNSSAAEVTTTDWVDTASSGFELSNSVGNLANVVGGTYLFLAIA
jgi:hypothetical protein